MKALQQLISIMLLAVSVVFSAQAIAEEGQCLIIHVPQESPGAFKQALNIANNLPKQMGADAVRVEIVAQGPGLKLLTKGSPEEARIKSLAVQSGETMGGGTQFKACAATIAGIKKKTGKEPVLIEGVEVTRPGAVARIIDAHYKEGCAYIRI
jgi:intracellular sulfur oxidation DsrE/DsrF family protein